MHKPLRLTCETEALAANWRWLASTAATATGAAIKADGYGLGASDALTILAEAGCRDFFVSTWWEAAMLPPTDGLSLAVLHGLGPDDVEAALQLDARPVLNSPAQVERWRQLAPARPCDVMVDTGMNRLGLRPEQIGLLDGLTIDTLHSHLACADEDHTLTDRQLDRFRQLIPLVKARRYSLANSAGILLGRNFSFDLVRPGLALYGGTPRPEARGHIRQVAFPQAQVVQRRLIRTGEGCGYGATFQATRDTEAAIINIGYADGYWRSFSSLGRGFVKGVELPVLGRVSMDLVTLGCDVLPGLAEGDWVELDFSLERSATLSGQSQYELLTGLGNRFQRRWV